mgnify:FL=1
MSLDVSLISQDKRKCTCKVCECESEEHIKLFSANITHNLNEMAVAAGIYEACWRPEEIGAKYAKDIIPLLTEGLAKLKASPAKYKAYDSPNGWGLYENFVPWVEKYLEACNMFPDAIIEVDR